MAPTKPDERHQPSNNRYDFRPRKIIAHIRTAEDYHAFNTDPKTIARRNQLKIRAKAVLQQEKDSMHIMLQAMEDLDVKKPNPSFEDELASDPKQQIADFNRAKLVAANERKLMKTMLRMSKMVLAADGKQKAKEQNERLMLVFEERYMDSLETARTGGRMLAEGLRYGLVDGYMECTNDLPSVDEAMRMISGKLEMGEEQTK